MEHELRELTISKDVKAKFMKELNEMTIQSVSLDTLPLAFQGMVGYK